MWKASAATSPAVLRPGAALRRGADDVGGVVAPDAGGIALGAQLAAQAHVLDGGDADAELPGDLVAREPIGGRAVRGGWSWFAMTRDDSRSVAGKVQQATRTDGSEDGYRRGQMADFRRRFADRANLVA